jgi:Fur family transcriptional regulator, zinc uptake regulator
MPDIGMTSKRHPDVVFYLSMIFFRKPLHTFRDHALDKTHVPIEPPMSQPVFHAPDHDHRRCTADALKHAEVLCAERAQRLTPIRRQVLEVLLESHNPLGAYEIMDRAAASGTRPAPITVYRALDFLRDNGLVHRIESRNAFVACVNNHASGDLVVFLLCERCGAVGEAASAAVADQLKAAARAAGFTPKTPVIEITGICSHCRAAT